MNWRIHRIAFASLAMSLPFLIYAKSQWPRPVQEIEVPTGLVVKARTLSFEEVSNAVHRFDSGHTVLLPGGMWTNATLIITNPAVTLLFHHEAAHKTNSIPGPPAP